MNNAAIMFCLVVTVLYSWPASGATRTACGYINYWDKHSHCDDGAQYQPGRRYPCVPNTKKAARDLVVELWDYDADGSDDYIGSWRWGSGYGCMTFEWENAAYAQGEANPDLYVKITSWKLSRANAPYILLREPDASTPVGLTWRTTNRINDCATGGNCVFSSEHVIGTNSVNDSYTILMNAGESADYPYVIYNDYNTRDIRLRWQPVCTDCLHPEDGPDNCGCGAASGFSDDLNTIRVPSNAAWPWYIAAHEYGHCLQADLLGLNHLRNDYGPNGDHSIEGQNPDSCAMQEGWPTYVALVGYWDPDNSSSRPIAWGYDFEEPQPMHHDAGEDCDDNRGVEGQVTKSFWDLDDAANDNAVSPGPTGENINEDTYDIAEGWYRFDDGTANREDYECDGDCSIDPDTHLYVDTQNGVNVWDYYYNNSAYFGGSFYSSFVWHNCQQTQDTN